MSVDVRAYAVLYVDDEASNLVTMRYVLEEQFTVLATASTAEALRLLAEREDIAVLIADQRMPEMTGAELCARARLLRPDVVRVIVTAYADLHMAMDAINRGQVSRYLTKPWRPDDLVETIRTSIELVGMQRTIEELEARLVRASPQAAASAISAEIAHELRNPLNGLGMTLEQLRNLLQAFETPEPDAARRELLTEAREAHEDAVAAYDQLTGLMRRLRQRSPSRPPAASSDLAGAVESAVRIARGEAERVATLEIVVEDSPQVAMDSTAVGQIVLNLLLNAAQAVALRDAPDHRITVRVGSDDAAGIIEVSDTGPGIPEDALPRIFDSHYTTKEGGSGLGLAVVRDLLRGADGHVAVTSTVGHGATFTVRIPKSELG